MTLGLLVGCYPHINHHTHTHTHPDKSAHKIFSPSVQARDFSLVSTEARQCPESIWNVTRNLKGKTALHLQASSHPSPCQLHDITFYTFAWLSSSEHFHLPRNLSSLQRSRSVRRPLWRLSYLWHLLPSAAAINGHHLGLKRRCNSSQRSPRHPPQQPCLLAHQMK